MSPATARRTQAERSGITRAALLDAAHGLFAERGFAGTSVDDVVAAAGLTKGALYHQFGGGKEELFAAVFEREQERMAADQVRAASGASDAWEALRLGCHAFLDSALEPGTQRIALLDGPGVLGWERLRELESPHAMRLLTGALEQSMAAGRIARRPVEPLANLLFGALCEAAMAIARAGDQRAALADTRREIDRLLDALAG